MDKTNPDARFYTFTLLIFTSDIKCDVSLLRRGLSAHVLSTTSRFNCVPFFPPLMPFNIYSEWTKMTKAIPSCLLQKSPSVRAATNTSWTALSSKCWIATGTASAWNAATARRNWRRSASAGATASTAKRISSSERPVFQTHFFILFIISFVENIYLLINVHFNWWQLS